MKEYLSVNGLWDIVGGTERELRLHQRRLDSFRTRKTARKHITLRAFPSQLNAVRLESYPKKKWDELQRFNRPGGFSTRMALRHELAKMQKGPKMPMPMWRDM